MFLRNTPGLDLTKVGELLGGSKELNKAVLHVYVDSFEFAGMELDLALREFLFHFRIPGLFLLFFVLLSFRFYCS